MRSHGQPAKKPCASVDVCDRNPNERQKAVRRTEAARLQWQLISGEQFRTRMAELLERSERLCEDSHRLIATANEMRKGSRMKSAKAGS